MHHSSLLTKILGYGILGAILVALFLNYTDSRTNLITPEPIALLFLSAAAAIVVVTVSVFFLWQEKTVEWIEGLLGPIGHVLHCGYCFSLWIAAGMTSVFGIDLIGNISPHITITFLVSWWGVGFFNVLCFELLTILWFQKVQSEFRLRGLYKNHEH